MDCGLSGKNQQSVLIVLTHNQTLYLTDYLLVNNDKCYLLPVFLLLQVEYSSSGEEESRLSSSMSSGRSVSSFCSCIKIEHGNESSWFLRNQVAK